MNRFFSLIALVALALWTPQLYKRATHGFRPEKCLIEWPWNAAWETVPLSPEDEQEVLSVLKQPFTYFAKGQQSFVFLSSDGKYVLKLFRFYTSTIPYGRDIEYRFKKWINPTVQPRTPFAIDVQKTFDSCRMAYEAADLTGLVYVHLNPGRKNLPLIRIRDRLHRIHWIDPAKYRFVLQKKAQRFEKTLKQADPLLLKHYVHSYLHLIDRLAALGLANHDEVMGRNFAFLNKEAIAIDIGNFYYDPLQALEDKKKFTSRFSRFLNKHRPEATVYLAD